MAGIAWNEQEDHSKWVLAGSLYACFGDMNRMTSQWKRGGSFFCLNDPTLVSALKEMIVSHDSC
jgi:deoxyribonuclease II